MKPNKDQYYVSAKVSGRTRKQVLAAIEAGEYVNVSDLVRRAVEDMLRLELDHSIEDGSIAIPVSANMIRDMKRLVRAGYYVSVDDLIRHAVDAEIEKCTEEVG